LILLRYFLGIEPKVWKSGPNGTSYRAPLVHGLALDQFEPTAAGGCDLHVVFESHGVLDHLPSPMAVGRGSGAEVKAELVVASGALGRRRIGFRHADLRRGSLLRPSRLRPSVACYFCCQRLSLIEI
jgi:hypothetical protein